jgi:DNA-binding transcriptional LysR family regulator
VPTTIKCREPLSHLFDAERVLTQTQKKLEGLLRITAPVIFGQETFYAFLSSFLKTYPRIQADQAQRKNAHTQVRRGRYWTRKQPFRGSLLQAILQ